VGELESVWSIAGYIEMVFLNFLVLYNIFLRLLRCNDKQR
jgi:hypothetical protein